MDQTNYVKTILNTLSSDIETYNAQLLAFEREIKRMKGGNRQVDNNRGYQKKEVQNKQISTFTKSVDNLNGKVIDLKVRMDRLNIMSKETNNRVRGEVDNMDRNFGVGQQQSQ
jgi:outer membrane murein-binding lipoprotein Lpp